MFQAPAAALMGVGTANDLKMMFATAIPVFGKSGKSGACEVGAQWVRVLAGQV